RPGEPVGTWVGATSPEIRSPGKEGRDDRAFARIPVEITDAIDLVLDGPLVREARFVGVGLWIEARGRERVGATGQVGDLEVGEFRFGITCDGLTFRFVIMHHD